jgi:NAD(P)-dependent dehydrogenase (short-subunit alcohol dehydrogenase family)
MGRVAVVTGAARGIGRAITLGLLAEGYAVAGLDIDEGALGDLVERAAASRLLTQACDVSVEDEVAAAMARTAAELGAISALVNNAAITAPVTGPLERLELTTWRRVVATNLDGAFLCCKHALPSLARERGAIVNLASTRALMSEPHGEAYGATKGAIVAFTHALAVSAGPAVRVNCISPGWIETSEYQPGASPVDLSERDHAQHPVGRVGRCEDIVALCHFLLSERAGFITGQNFVVDGGMTRKMVYAE